MSSELKITTIKHSGASGDNITLWPSNNVQFAGNLNLGGELTAGTIGSAVTGFTGAKEVDFWRLNADNTEVGGTIMNSTLERVDDTSEKIGTGMTKNGSGIFSFPSTGKYIIQTIANFKSTSGGQQYGGLHLEVTTNDSSYNAYNDTYQGVSGTNYYGTASGFYFLDVTDISNIKVRFKKVVYHDTNYPMQGHASQIRTGILFIRIGDT